MTLLQTPTTVIPRTLNEKMILQHLLTHPSRHETLVSFRIHLHKPGLLPSDLFKFGKDTGGGVVISCSEDLSAEYLGAIFQGCCDEFS
jgi:hypothetical protein